ncbi:MAG TPA: hypothetical protein VKZ60_00830 [Chloroflexota bacterium]|nr:hypothetical protein [Chloroflexota bacterium]
MSDDGHTPVWRLVADCEYRGFRLLVQENVSPAARRLIHEIQTYFPERRWSFVPMPRGWYVFCAIAPAPDPLADLLVTREFGAHRSHAAEGHTWCNDTLQPRPEVMNLDEPEMLARLREQVDRYLAARAVLAARLGALRARRETL